MRYDLRFNFSTVELCWKVITYEVVLPLGQFCALAKMYHLSSQTAFRISAWVKYAMSSVYLSRAV